VVVAGALLLAGCQEIRNEQVGYGVGGALGGLVGSQIGGGTGRLAATAAGALFGAYLGGNVGRTMDDVDRMKTRTALEGAPTGQSTTWKNPDTGNTYEVTPTKTYQESGRPCREYTTDAWIDGRKETLRGTACREPDGSWRAL
jgi:surface antigen